MKLITHPITILVLGLTLGIGVGLGWFWSEAGPRLQAVQAQRSMASTLVPPDKPWDFWTIEIDNLAAELKGEKETLAQREATLVRREERLGAERQELAKMQQQVEQLRDDIERRLTQIQADELKNLKTLAQTYANLSPKAALSILREMEDSMIVKILSLMKSDVVSPIFEEMGKSAATDPALAQRAAALSEKLRFMKAPATNNL